MRTLYRLVPLLLVLALAACASSQPMARSSAPTSQHNLMHDDAEYIGRVNAEARRRGLLVHWINPQPKNTAPRSIE